MTDPSNVYRHKLIRITDLATTADVLEEFLFEDCAIHGPAVLLALDGFQLRNCTIEGEASLWDLAPERAYIGGVGIKACMFERCSFHRIGFAGNPAFMAVFRRDLGL